MLALVICLVFSITACDEGAKIKEEGKETQKPGTQTQAPSTETKKPVAEENKEKVPLDTDPTTVDDVETLDTNVEGVETKDCLISLGEYKGVEIKVLSTEVTKEEIAQEVKNLLESYPTYEDLDSNTAADANFVDIDFVGKIDGKEFEGGSAKGQILLLGSNTYIEGFEDGIIGMKKGETKDLELKFPKDYHNKDYAGKDVVFTVTLNRIMKKVETKYTDEFVKENFGKDYKLTTVAEMDKYIKDMISEDKKSQAESYKINAVFEEIINNSEFKDLPQQWINYYYVNDYLYVQDYANAYGMKMEDCVKQFMDKTLEEYKKETLEYAIESVKMDIVLDAIATTEKLEVTDEYYAEEVKKVFESYSGYFEDINQFVEANGGKAEITKQLLLEKARDYAVDNAKVVGTIDKIPQDKDEASDKTEDTSKKEETKEDAK